jgi:uncharacterized protein YndB with AHSA1/START domain
LHYLNAAPISAISERWINHYDQERVHALADLKQALETPTMHKPSFVYTTYIETTPERLWQALTEPAFTERYWSTTFETDWEAGSTMTWNNHGVRIADAAQVVLEADPFRRLSYTWHDVTPELAQRFDWSAELLATLAAEPRSKVTFEIELAGKAVKLTVTHDDFETGSTFAEMVSEGWPRVLSDLKTLLETGETLRTEPGTSRADAEVLTR